MTEEELDLLFKRATNYANTYSSDSETKVGALLLRTTLKSANRVITGATGLPTVRPDKYEYILHAEANLVFKAAETGISMYRRTVFCTLSPCQNCIRTMFQAGIREVYYKEVYRDYNPNMRDIQVTETKVGPYTKMVLSNYE